MSPQCRWEQWLWCDTVPGSIPQHPGARCLPREVLTFTEQRAALLLYFANQNRPGVSEASAIPAESCLVMPGVYACETVRGGRVEDFAKIKDLC